MANMYINAMSALWNNASTVYSAIKMNVSQSAYSVQSMLLQLQVNGSDRFSVLHDGTIITQKNLKLPSAGVIDFNAGDVTVTHTPNELTFAGGSYIFDGVTEVTSTDPGAAAGPIMRLERNSPSAQDGDAIGAINFRGKNVLTPTAGNTDYANISAHIIDVGDAVGIGEDGELRLSAQVNGALLTGLQVHPIAPANTAITTTTPRLRLTATASADDAAYNSTTHAFQVGGDAGGRIIMDSNEFQSYNGAAASSMYINGSTIGWNGALVLSTQPNAAPNFATVDTYPYLMLDKVWTPAAAGVVARVIARGRDSANNTVEYGNLQWTATDVTNGSEDATCIIQNMVAGGMSTRLTLDNLGVNIAGDCDLTTTLHVGSTTAPAANTAQPAFAIGALTGANLAMGPANIMARNNGSLATLTLNTGCTISSTGVLTTPQLVSNGSFAANGITMGSDVASSLTDLTQHIALYGTTYGLNVTSGNINMVSGGGFQFVSGTVKASISSAGALSCASISTGTLTTSDVFTFDSYCISSDTAAIYGTTGAGNVYLRPNGSGSATGELRVYSSGTVTVTALTATGQVSSGGLDAGAVFINANGAITGVTTFTASGAISGATVTATSDETLKREIVPIDPVVAHRVMLALHGYHFQWTDSDRKQSGMIAQEVIKAGAPELVFEDEEGKLSLNYNGLLAYVASAYHYQEARIADLENKIRRLEALVIP